MPYLPIPISKGLFQNVDAMELASPEYATELKNLMLNDAGSNVSRPGLRVFATLGNYPVVGLTFVSLPGTSALFAVTQDRKMWAIDSSGAVRNVTGEILGGTKRPVFASDGAYLAIAGGGLPQRWAGALMVSTGTEPAFPYHQTEIMPGDPHACDSIVYLDGYWIAPLQHDQELRWAGPTASARDDWDTSQFFSAEALPDNILATAVLLRDLYVFGPTTTEVFRNYGDSSVPFKRLEGGFIDKGIAAPHSIVVDRGLIAWLNSDRRIVGLEGATPVPISTPFDRVIRDLHRVDDCWGTIIDLGGVSLAAWTFPEAARTFVFNYKSKEWSEWEGYRNGEAVPFRMNSHVFATENRRVQDLVVSGEAWNRHFVGDPARGTIYELTPEAHDDAGDPRRLLRRSGQIDHGTGSRKRSWGYRFHVKRGVGTGTDEPVFQFRVNDDGKGWTPYITVELGLPGAPQAPIDVRLRGVYRKRQIEISMTDAAEFVLHKLEENVELLGS